MLVTLSNTPGARHRADRRPKTILSSFGEALSGSRTVRRGVLAAATSSLAITMAATTASAASPSGSVPQAAGTAFTAQAAAVTVPANASWGLNDAPAASSTSGTTHTVQAGDTVAKLAQRYGSTVSGIISANGLNAQALIHVGETLTIPSGSGSSSSSTSSSSASTSTNASVQTTSSSVDRSSSAASRSSSRSAPGNSSGGSAPTNSSGSAIVNIAYKYIGTPYAWGGTTPAAFDCSGFTSYVYAQAGISLPRSSSAQLGAGTRVSASAAQPGDLVWWPGHVGIYVGGGQYIAAHSPGNPLSVRDIYKPNPTFIRVG